VKHPIRLALIVACVLVVSCVDNPDSYESWLEQELESAQAENEELYAALELFTRNEGSCAVREGTRVICAMAHGALQRRDMEPGEYIAFRSERRKK
jgi:hypothetical protein